MFPVPLTRSPFSTLWRDVPLGPSTARSSQRQLLSAAAGEAGAEHGVPTRHHDSAQRASGRGTQVTSVGRSPWGRDLLRIPAALFRGAAGVDNLSPACGCWKSGPPPPSLGRDLQLEPPLWLSPTDRIRDGVAPAGPSLARRADSWAPSIYIRDTVLVWPLRRDGKRGKLACRACLECSPPSLPFSRMACAPTRVLLAAAARPTTPRRPSRER